MPPRSLLRTSRRRLAWLLVGFAVWQFVLAVAIDGWLPTVRDPEHAAQLDRLRARLAEAPGRPLVLMLGSSRTAYGLDAASLSVPAQGRHPLVFNFGIMGSGPFLQLITLRRLLDDGVRPDLLYVEVMPAMFARRSSRLLEERRLDGARLRLSELLYLSDYCRQPRWLLLGWCLGRLLPCYRHQAEVRNHLGLDTFEAGAALSDPGFADGHGWRVWCDGANSELRRRTSDLAQRQYRDVCTLPASAVEPLRALEELLALCRREGIPVSLVLMPEGRPFRALYSAAARETFARVLEKLRKEWGVVVVDARTWAADEDFWDTHHLLPPGARRFTTRFAQEALRPALAQLVPPRSRGPAAPGSLAQGSPVAGGTSAAQR